MIGGMPEEPPIGYVSLRSEAPDIISPFWANLPAEHYTHGTLAPPPTPPVHAEHVHHLSLLHRLGLAVGLAALSFAASGGVSMPAMGATTAIVQTVNTEARTDALIRTTPAHDGDTQGIFHSLLHRAGEEAQRWMIDECCTTLGGALWWAARHRKELPEKTLRALEWLESFLDSAQKADVVRVLDDADAPAEEMHRRGCKALGVMVLDRSRHVVHSLICGDGSLASAEGEALSSAISERLTAHLPVAEGGTALVQTVIECVARSIAKQGLRSYCAAQAQPG
jgi:hypothetical protein